MKNIRLSFNSFVIISFVIFIGNLLLLLVNSKTMDLWSYVILTGILPIIILSFLNTFLFKENSFKEKLFPVMFISAAETIILMIASVPIDVKKVIENTNLKSDEFSLSVIATDDKLGDFLTVWISLIGITFVLTLISKLLSSSKPERR